MSNRDEALRQLLHTARSTTVGLTSLAQLLDNALAPSETRARQHVGSLARAAGDLEATLARARSLLRPPRPPASVALAPLVRDAFALVEQEAPALPDAQVIADREALSFCLAELVSALARDGRALEIELSDEDARVVLAFSSAAPALPELTETIVVCLAERAGAVGSVTTRRDGAVGRIELRRGI
jgi:hypothetical protein